MKKFSLLLALVLAFSSCGKRGKKSKKQVEDKPFEIGEVTVVAPPLSRLSAEKLVIDPSFDFKELFLFKSGDCDDADPVVHPSEEARDGITVELGENTKNDFYAVFVSLSGQKSECKLVASIEQDSQAPSAPEEVPASLSFGQLKTSGDSVEIELSPEMIREEGGFLIIYGDADGEVELARFSREQLESEAVSFEVPQNVATRIYVAEADAAGNASSLLDTGSVIEHDNIAPEISSEFSDARVSSSGVISGSCEENLTLAGSVEGEIECAQGAFEIPLAGLADGQHSVEAVSVDDFGNERRMVFSFEVDSTGPASSVVSGPLSSGEFDTNSPVLEIGPSHVSLGDAQLLEFCLSENCLFVTRQEFESSGVSLPLVENTENTLKIATLDDLGNKTQMGPYPVRHDNVAPEAELANAELAAGLLITNGGNLSIGSGDISVGDAVSIELCAAECSAVGAQQFAQAGVSAPLVPNTQNDVAITLADAAGNKTRMGPYSVEHDDVAPEVNSQEFPLADQVITTNVDAFLVDSPGLGVSEDVHSVEVCSAALCRKLPKTEFLDSGVTLDLDADSANEFSVAVFDRAGNKAQLGSFTVIQDSIAPEITQEKKILIEPGKTKTNGSEVAIGVPAEFLEGTDAQYLVLYADAEGAEELARFGRHQVESGQTVFQPPFNAETAIFLSLVDEAGNESAPWNSGIVVSHDDIAPILESDFSLSQVGPGHFIEIRCEAPVRTQDPLHVDDDCDGDGLATVQLAPLEDGDHVVTVYSADDHGNESSLSFSFNMDATAPEAAVVGGILLSESPVTNESVLNIDSSQVSAGDATSIEACVNGGCLRVSRPIFDSTGADIDLAANSVNVVLMVFEDEYGNRSQLGPFEVEQDSVAPQGRWLNPELASGSLLTNSPTLALDPQKIDISDAKEVDFCINEDCFTLGASQFGANGAELSLPANSESSVKAVLRDALGNQSELPAVLVTHDSIEPAARVLSQEIVQGQLLIQSDELFLSGSDLELGEDSTQAMFCVNEVCLSVDSANFALSGISLSGFAEGENFLLIESFDAAGNKAQLGPYIVTRDSNLPFMQISQMYRDSGLKGEGLMVAGTGFVFTGDMFDFSGDIAEVAVCPGSPCAPGASGVPFSLFLESGSSVALVTDALNPFYFKLTSQHGSSADFGPYFILSDTTGPAISNLNSELLTGVAVPDISYAFNREDLSLGEDVDRLELCRDSGCLIIAAGLEKDPVAGYVHPAGADVEVSLDENSVNSFYIRLYDKLGNHSTSTSPYKVESDTVAPAAPVLAESVSSLEYYAWNRYESVAGGTGADAETVKIVDSSSGSVLAEGAASGFDQGFTVDMGSANANLELQAFAVDKAGNVSQPSPFTVRRRLGDTMNVSFSVDQADLGDTYYSTNSNAKNISVTYQGVDTFDNTPIVARLTLESSDFDGANSACLGNMVHSGDVCLFEISIQDEVPGYKSARLTLSLEGIPNSSKSLSFNYFAFNYLDLSWGGVFQDGEIGQVFDCFGYFAHENPCSTDLRYFPTQMPPLSERSEIEGYDMSETRKNEEGHIAFARNYVQVCQYTDSEGNTLVFCGSSAETADMEAQIQADIAATEGQRHNFKLLGVLFSGGSIYAVAASIGKEVTGYICDGEIETGRHYVSSYLYLGGGAYSRHEDIASGEVNNPSSGGLEHYFYKTSDSAAVIMHPSQTDVYAHYSSLTPHQFEAVLYSVESGVFGLGASSRGREMNVLDMTNKYLVVTKGASETRQDPKTRSETNVSGWTPGDFYQCEGKSQVSLSLGGKVTWLDKSSMQNLHQQDFGYLFPSGDSDIKSYWRMPQGDYFAAYGSHLGNAAEGLIGLVPGSNSAATIKEGTGVDLAYQDRLIREGQNLHLFTQKGEYHFIGSNGQYHCPVSSVALGGISGFSESSGEWFKGNYIAKTSLPKQARKIDEGSFWMAKYYYEITEAGWHQWELVDLDGLISQCALKNASP